APRTLLGDPRPPAVAVTTRGGARPYLLRLHCVIDPLRHGVIVAQEELHGATADQYRRGANSAPSTATCRGQARRDGSAVHPPGHRGAAQGGPPRRGGSADGTHRAGGPGAR